MLSDCRLLTKTFIYVCWLSPSLAVIQCIIACANEELCVDVVFDCCTDNSLFFTLVFYLIYIIGKPRAAIKIYFVFIQHTKLLFNFETQKIFQTMKIKLNYDLIMEDF